MTLRYSPTERTLKNLLTVEGVENYRLQPTFFDVAALEDIAPGVRDGLELVVNHDIKGQLALEEIFSIISDSLSFKYGEFLHGRCHILAITLHKTYGLPLEGSLEYDFDIDGLALQHAWVRWDEHNVIDAAGLRPFKLLANEFGVIQEVCSFKPNELYRLGGKSSEGETKLVKQLARNLVILAESASSSGCALSQQVQP